jgi:hypothetical protein
MSCETLPTAGHVSSSVELSLVFIADTQWPKPYNRKLTKQCLYHWCFMWIVYDEIDANFSVYKRLRGNTNQWILPEIAPTHGKQTAKWNWRQPTCPAENRWSYEQLYESKTHIHLSVLCYEYAFSDVGPKRFHKSVYRGVLQLDTHVFKRRNWSSHRTVPKTSQPHNRRGWSNILSKYRNKYKNKYQYTFTSCYQNIGYDHNMVYILLTHFSKI